VKRQNEIFKTTIENIKYESEKIISEVKERHKDEISELQEQNHALHLRVDDSKDKDLVRQLRRDLEEHKRRCLESNTEANEFRRERD
jgi:F0F1-type ATP synthase membrane subunit b/b'